MPMSELTPAEHAAWVAANDSMVAYMCRSEEFDDMIRAVVAAVRPEILREAASLLAEDARHRDVYRERANRLVTQGIEDAAVRLNDRAAELEGGHRCQMN